MSSKPLLKLDWCSYTAAKYAVEHWHYSGSLPTPPLVKIGVWEADQFIGCILFSRGANNNLCKAYSLAITDVSELTRVALASHATATSRIVTIATRLLAATNPGLRLLVSYADPNHGHHGGIYQACGWIYDGKTGKDFAAIDRHGRRWHSRQVSHTGVKRQYGTLRRVPKHSECRIIPLLGKHRYLYPLDAAMRAQILPLAQPYPKRVGSIRDAPAVQAGEGRSTLTRRFYPEATIAGSSPTPCTLALVVSRVIVCTCRPSCPRKDAPMSLGRRWLMVLVLAWLTGAPFAAVAQAITCTPVTTLKTTVTLTWTPAVQPAGVTPTAYVLERQTDTGPWVPLIAPPLTQVTATDTGLLAGHTYTYRLSLSGKLADGTLGVSGYASQGTPAPCVTITVVQAPASLTATPQ